MLHNLSVLFLVFAVSMGKEKEAPKQFSWELAVVVNDKIELMHSNGTMIGTTFDEFTKLKALAFDSIRHQFVVSDSDSINDTIFSVDLTKENDVTAIIQDLPDDVQGLAIDPIEDILYWTDSINRTINKVSLKENRASDVDILFNFAKQKPQGIAVDACRRYVYWTNSDLNRPTIERALMNGSGHEILVDSDLKIPMDITVDYVKHRIYWTDLREGIYFRIESADLNGKNRKIVYEGVHSQPFGIAVDRDSIYFTDTNNNALWKLKKSSTSVTPEKLREFKEKPLGVITRNVVIASLPDCENFKEAERSWSGESDELFVPFNIQPNPATTCINGVMENDRYCRCHKGYTGESCELSVCHNFCFQGNCRITPQGYPQCHCPSFKFGGPRCEKDCSGYCFNDGQCRFPTQNSRTPSCLCRAGYEGERCEISSEFINMCGLICSGVIDDEIIKQKGVELCKCSDNNDFYLSRQSEKLIQNQNSDFSGIYQYFQDPIFIVLLCVAITLLLVSSSLIGYVLFLKRRPNPRIRRRYIVNKNVTPLTSRQQRHQPTEQCEITIENCCNMNVCETPCYEPSKLQSYTRKDDKKILLANMEHPEDF